MTATGTLTITDFLWARIAEDEERARKALWLDGYFAASELSREWRYVHLSYGIDGQRALAECKAKREVVDECERSILNDKDSRTAEWIAAQLATVYASHPDYNPAWAPKS